MQDLTIGLAIIPLASGVITEFFSWRIATLGYGFGFLSAAYAWNVRRRANPNCSTTEITAAGVGTAMRTPVIVTTITVGTLSFAIIFGVFLTAMPDHLDTRFAMSSGCGAS